MKSKIVVFWCIFLIVPIVIALTEEKVIIQAGESLLRNGKNITFTGISGSELNFDVDGVTEAVKVGEEEYIGGVTIAVSEYSKSPTIAIINISIDFTCGDGTCSDKESNLICCADCGCLGLGKLCQSNRCIENISSSYSEYECNTNADCGNRTCLLGFCDTSITPYQCGYNPITACMTGDQCCPEVCDTQTDSDCATVDKCKASVDCDDGNACTEDSCSGTPKRCAYAQAIGCTLNGKCLPSGSIDKGRFCAASSWEYQKTTDAPCQTDYECISGSCAFEKCRDQTNSTPWYVKTLIFAVILLAGMVLFYTALQKRTKPRQPLSGQP